MNKVLVTGADGFVGKSLCEKLLQSNFSVIAAVRTDVMIVDQPGMHKIKITDLRQNVDWKELCSGFTDIKTVIHLASRVHIMNETSRNPLAQFRRVNVQATVDLARYALKSGVKRFIYLSTIKVNGEITQNEQRFQASDLAAPADPYALSKYEAEQCLLDIAKNSTMEIVIIRPPLVYGPRVKGNFLKLMRLLKRGIPLPLGSINNARSLVSLSNLHDLIIVCINHPQAANEIFLISDGEDLSTPDLLRRLAWSLGYTAKIFPVPVAILTFFMALACKKSIALRLCGSLQVDISKNRRLLNWEPPHSVNEEFNRTALSFISPVE